jgi:hypothetical protein
LKEGGRGGILCSGRISCDGPFNLILVSRTISLEKIRRERVEGSAASHQKMNSFSQTSIKF